jgi:hypothetical protein
VLYKFVDQDITNGTTMWVTLTAAPVELKGTAASLTAKSFWADLTVHHTTDANNDIFQVVGTYSISKTYEDIGTGDGVHVDGGRSDYVVDHDADLDGAADRSAGLVQCRVRHPA